MVKILWTSGNITKIDGNVCDQRKKTIHMMNEETPVVLPFSLIREKLKDSVVYRELYGIPNPMAMHKKEKSKKNRKKERGVKHGRRKK